MLRTNIFTNFLTFSRSEIWFLIATYVLALAIRGYALWNDYVLFFYDQARDAVIARQIVVEGDLKLQGPPASGTQETLYHGVMYYYLIAVLYAVSSSPTFVAFGLAALNSLAIIPVYLLVKEVTRSRRAAILAVLLFCVALETVHAAVWLSNPNLLVLSLSWFYFGLWRVFFRQQPNYLPLVAVSLGLSHQLVVFTVFLWGGVVVSSWYLTRVQRQSLLKFFTRRQLLVSCLLYLATLSTMILTQAILFQRGIFSWSTLASATVQPADHFWTNWWVVIELFVKKLSLSLLPSWPWLSVPLALYVLWRFGRSSTERKWFLLAWLGAPLWLFVIHPRNAYHALMSLELAIFLAFSWYVTQPQLIQRKPRLIAILIAVVVVSQFWSLVSYRQAKQFLYEVRQGTLLTDQLQVIRFTYQHAQNQPFSLSVLSNPYGYSTTWAYLYDWQAQQSTQPLPWWKGPDQTGLPGGELLSRTLETLPLHFVIEERGAGMEPWLISSFEAEQGITSDSVSWQHFGEIRVMSLTSEPASLELDAKPQ